MFGMYPKAYVSIQYLLHDKLLLSFFRGGSRGRDRMVVGFTTTCAISGEFESRSWRDVLNTTVCDKVLSVTCDRSVVFSGYSGFLHQ